MELNNIVVQFGEKRVLDGFYLQIPERGILCLYGPSGCGKTTLLRVLAGLTVPESGTLTGNGACSMVFQEDRLLPWLSVEKNITVAAGVSQETARRWLRLAGLEAEARQHPEQLSGGMRRRVAILRALAADSDYILLDEPFQGLDEKTKELLYEPIREAAETKPVILVTHHREEAEALGAEVLELSGPPLLVKGQG